MRSLSHLLRRALLLASSLLAPACVLTPEVIGDTLTGASTGETGVGATDGVGTTSAGPESGAYGSPCALVGAPKDLQITAISLQPACDAGICLLVNDRGPWVCEEDASCAVDEGPGSVCGENGFCNMTPSFVEENTRCTATCEVDTDCPELPGCVAGPACATITNIGELCCAKVCACQDHLNPAQTATAEANCVADPEFCDNQAP